MLDEFRALLMARDTRVVDYAVLSMWKSFYSLYDFESEPDAPSDGDISGSLHRSLGVRHRPR
jgi:hypothetical protein